MTKAQKAKLIAALQAELAAAKATKDAISEAFDPSMEAAFDDACRRVRSIEESIHYVSSPRYKIDARTAELVANNVD